MPIGKRGSIAYSPKDCFLAWFETGTLTKAVLHLERQGIVNSKGKPPHFNTVRRNTYIYIINHPEEARDLLRGRNQYFALDDDIWNDWIVERAKMVLAKGGNLKSFYAWLSKYGLLEAAVKFGHVPPTFSLESVT